MPNKNNEAEPAAPPTADSNTSIANLQKFRGDLRYGL